VSVSRFDYQALYRWLVDCAERNVPAPSNDVIAERLGMRSGSSGADGISKLVRDGLIHVERTKATRRVTIVASGKATAWTVPVLPASTVPHDPQVIAKILALHQKGMTYLGIACKVHLTKSKVAGIVERHRPRPIKEPMTAPPARPQLMAIGPARTCQFITGTDFLDRMRRGENIYCGRPSVEGRSWCDFHYAVCMVKPKEKAA
jgi:hypothetical protein